MSDYEEPTREVLFDRIEKQFFFDNNEATIPLPSEGLRIVKDKLTDIRDYANKRNYDDSRYEDIFWEAHEILSDFYWYLDTHSTENLPGNDEETGEDFKKAIALDVQGNPKKLWRLYHPDTFSSGSKLWARKDMPGYFDYSPVAAMELDDCTSKYLEKKWMCHPYINWAIINAYLLHAGRMQISNYDDKYRYEAISSMFSKESPTEVNIGVVFETVLEFDANYSIFKTKFKKRYAQNAIISIAVTVAVTIALKTFTDYSKTANVIFCLGLLFAFADFIYTRKELVKKMQEIDQMRNLLVALKEAWVAANSPSVDLTRIKDKVDAAEKMGYRYPQPFHALLTDTIAKYGNTLSVMTWVSY